MNGTATSTAHRMFRVLADHGHRPWLEDGVVTVWETGTVTRDTDVDGPFLATDGTWVTGGRGTAAYAFPVSLVNEDDMWAWLGY